MFDTILSMFTQLLLLFGRAEALEAPNLCHEVPPFAHRLAAVIYETPDISAEELLRVECHESHYLMDAGPTAKRWPHDPAKFPPLRTAKTRGLNHYICGLLQTTEYSAETCVAMQKNVFLAFQRGADQINRWHIYCRRWGYFGKRRYVCARAGYAKGTAAALAAVLDI